MLSINYSKCYFQSLNSLIKSTIRIGGFYTKFYYIPSKPVIFNKGKCQLITSSFTSTLSSILNDILFSTLSGLTLYKGIKSVIRFKLFPSLFYWSSFFYTSNMLINHKANQRNIITSIALYDNGQKVQVSFNTSSKPKDFDIKLFRSFTASERKFYQTLPLFQTNNTNTQYYYPVIIDDRLFLIRKSIMVMNKELLNAVLKGKYIKVNQSFKGEDIVNI